MVPIVLQEGVDVDEENEAGRTALHVAVVNNDLEMVKFLLSRGAAVNRRTRLVESDPSGAVQATCECANSAYCFHLADEYGNEMRHDGQNALHLAAKHSSDQMLRLLLGRIDNVDARSDDGATALLYATQNFARGGAVGVRAMELLLEAGADVNATNGQGKTPLYLAVKFERLELVEHLLSRGADVNISTARRSTPLYSAIANCHVELVNLLLENGASIDAQNQRNQTPLFHALRVVPRGDERTALVETLLDHGLPPDCRNNHGSTALHVAVQDKDESLARLMIARGCAIDAKDCFDVSPLAVAVCTNLHRLAELLLEGGADASVAIRGSSALEHAIIRRNEAMVELLLRRGAKLNEREDRVLSAACMHKSTRIMQMLIDRGADVNHKDGQGSTPLMRVIREPNYTMMRHLLERGARVNERDRRGNTALHPLFDNSSHTKEHIVEYLLERGADVNVENDDGHTAFGCMMFRCFTKRVVLTFVKHVALLLAQNRPVNPKIIRQIQANHTWKGYLSSCQAELGRMREARILDKCSCYDLLTRRHSALGLLFREANATLEFELGLRTNALFNYCDLLKRCFQRKDRRFKLLKNGVEVLTNEVFRDIFPPEVVEYLCDLLSNDDLQKLL